MVARKSNAGIRGKLAAARSRCAGILVEDEQRRHLIEDCAFFRAARFRAAEPGKLREQDLRAAAAVIDAAIKPRRRRRKGR